MSQLVATADQASISEPAFPLLSTLDGGLDSEDLTPFGHTFLTSANPSDSPSAREIDTLFPEPSELSRSSAKQTTTQPDRTPSPRQGKEASGWFGKLFFASKPKKTHSATYYRRVGGELLNRGYPKEAVRALERAIDLGAFDLECQLHLSLAYARTGRLSEATALLYDLKSAHPFDAGVATLLGKALLYSSRYSAAIKVMSPVAKIHKKRFNLHFFLGLAHAKKGEFDAAIDAWTQAAKIRPDHSETRRMIERALAEKIIQG
ncbi:MAG: tetratricopeptide repeat protein [Magnetococcales bacterium]|nr:tetratricopeptide repeat protein [Magnetococcales bacterium]